MVLATLWTFSKYLVNKWMKDWEGESKETKGNLVISVNSRFMTKTSHNPKSNYIINGLLYTGWFSPAYSLYFLSTWKKGREKKTSLLTPHSRELPISLIQFYRNTQRADYICCLQFFPPIFTWTHSIQAFVPTAVLKLPLLKPPMTSTLN